MKIPFNRPCLEGAELRYVREAVEGGQIGGDGTFSARCHARMEELLSARKVLLTTSCTDALELAALLADVQPGDEVILPSFTFTSTANAFCLRGARPVFVDIRPDTLNLDETQLAGAVTERTKVIVPVHYAGVACAMEPINAIAREHDLVVIEDAAQGFLATYRGKSLGTLGDIGCFSFHETKTIMSGEGGAIVLNREADITRAEVLREKGTNRSAFFRGDVDKYTWVDVGSSFLPTDLIGAFLYGQLEAADRIIATRKAIYDRYESLLASLAERGLFTTMVIPADCTVNYHLYYLLVRDAATRTGLLDHLRAQGILAVFHYVPLHTAPYAQQLGIDVHLPVTDDVAERLIRLPFFNALTEAEQNYIAACIADYFGG